MAIANAVFNSQGASSRPHSESEVQIWDSKGKALQRTIPMRGVENITSLTFSPDGTTVACGLDKREVRLWDTKSGQLKQALKTDEADILAVSASASADAMGMRIIGGDTPAGIQGIVRDDNSPTTAVAFSPDGKTLASAQGYRAPFIKLWDVATGHVRQRLVRLQADWITSLAFSPDSQSIVSGGGGQFEMFQPFGMIRLWNAQSGEMQWAKGASAHALYPVAYSKSGKFLVAGFAGGGGIAQLWDAHTAQLKGTFIGNDVADIAFSSNETMVATAGLLSRGQHSGGGIQLWNSATGRLLKTFTGREFGMDAVAFSPDGSRIAGAAENIRLWDITSGKVLRTLKAEASVLAFSPNGKFLVSGGEQENSNQLTLWNVQTGKPVWTQKSSLFSLGKMAFSPDGLTLATIDVSLKIHLKDTATGRDKRILTANGLGPTSVSFLQSGQTIAGVSPNGTVRYWDVKSGVATPIGKGSDLAQYVMDVSSQGKRIASSGENVLKFWDAQKGDLLATIEILGLRRGKSGFSADWIAYTPQGFYESSPNATEMIRWRVGEQLYPAEKFSTEFHRPDLLQKSLRGE